MKAHDIHSINDVELITLDIGPEISHHTADGVYIRQLSFPTPGIFMGQHAHAYEHATMVASGKVRLWIDDIEKGDFKGGECINVAANAKHTLMSLEPSILYCIHNVSRLGEVEISEHVSR